jgi:hypothetical protein
VATTMLMRINAGRLSKNAMMPVVFAMRDIVIP